VRINFGWFILGDDMVALSENGFYHNDTTAQSVRRKGESAQPKKALDQGCSVSSVSSGASVKPSVSYELKGVHHGMIR
jgi:hypothetical protein